MTEEFEQDQPDDTMFQDAVAALRKGDKPRAKELLTLLLKADQNNPRYWIWLSAAMDSSKERVYCLQTALKLDPENGAAKRGLILLGALPADESIQPFVMNRPRAWEQKLLLANEIPREKGLKAFMKSPALRIAGIFSVVAGLVVAVMFAFALTRQSTAVEDATFTPGPSPTFTTTPTVFGAVGEPTKSVIGPTPLWMLLPQTYTPTVVYINTPREINSKSQFREAQKSYEKGDWDAYIANLEFIIPLEPKAADIHYYVGEGYRMKGESKNAKDAYNDALKVDPNFAPAYLGLARIRMVDDPAADIKFLFDEAIKRDANFSEAYVERANYFILRSDPKSALKDLDRANKLSPESPVIYMAYARAYVAMDDKEKALKAAEKAYSLDITALPVYQLLGELYIENEQYDRALEALGVYVVYETQDDDAFARLGRAYYEMKNYELALESLNRAMKLNPTGLRRYYVYRGLVNIEMNNEDQAVEDLEKAVEFDGTSFEVNFGLARAYFLQEKFGTAFQKIEAAVSLAKGNENHTIQALYWRALIQEKRNQRQEAARDWQALLAMDSDLVTDEMREEATQHLISMSTFTPTPKAGAKTPTPTATKPKGGTPTPTPKNVIVTVTVTPTSTLKVGTPTPTPTKKP